VTPRSAASAPSRRDLAGFTLVELLVAVVISGILAGVIFKLVNQQGRLVQMQSSREDVQQNSRGVLELLSSEMRGISASRGVSYAGKDTIQVRSPLVWGVYCGSASGSTFVLFDKTVWQEVSTYIPSNRGLSVEPADGSTAQVFSNVAYDAVSLAGTPCAALDPDAASVQAVRIASVAPSGSPTVGASRAYLFQQVEYRAALSSDNSVWVRRAVGGGTVEPLAGPVDSLRFRYLNAAGSVIPPIAGKDTVLRTSVRGIRVIAATKSRAKGIPVQRQVDSATIFLRN
jgi:prepilin-type N-terminal cleavage/methylation domain-containing protein